MPSVMTPGAPLMRGRFHPGKRPVPPATGSDPFALVATAVAPLEVRLSWSHASPPADTRYELERDIGGTWHRFGTAYKDSLTYTDWGRTPSTSYSYRLRAVNSGGTSAYTSTASATTIADDGAGEFCGPFPSWKNVKMDYGAVGNGVADDTTAIQNALNDLRLHTAATVLFFPAGTYKLTALLQTIRAAHSEYQGISIIGEDPATTTLKWAGAVSGIMLDLDAWYCTVSRLTFDGQSTAGNGLYRWRSFSSYNEVSDCVFKDFTDSALQLGSGGAGQAETTILRCQFLRCAFGVRTGTSNSLDAWVMFCRFTDCGEGVRNGSGNWHCVRNVFERSTVADMRSSNCAHFAMQDNVSKDSFLSVHFGMFQNWGAQTSVIGNRIINPGNGGAIFLGSGGPFLVVDNLVRLGAVAPDVYVAANGGIDGQDSLFTGNTYNIAPNVIESLAGRFYNFDAWQSTVPIDDTLPYLPGTPPNLGRTIVEVAAGASAATIQAAITSATATGNWAVVHLPLGDYNIASTLTVAAGAKIQIIGDGAGDASSGQSTRLTWTGAGGGTLLQLTGPSKTVVRDIGINPGTGRGIYVTNADQAGASIHSNQLFLTGSSPLHGLFVNGVENADVTALSINGDSCQTWVRVVGGSMQATGALTNGRVGLFLGASASSDLQYNVENGGTLFVRGIYHENSNLVPTVMNLTGQGRLSIDATRFSYPPDVSNASIKVNGFNGDIFLGAIQMRPVTTPPAAPLRVAVSGNGSQTRFLMTGAAFLTDNAGVVTSNVWTDTSSPAAQAFFKLSNINHTASPATESPIFHDLAEVGSPTDTFQRSMLNTLRRARLRLPGDTPSGVTDVRLHRLFISGGSGATDIEVAA